MKARQDYGIGPDIWDYEVLEEPIMDSHEELVKMLRERQTYWIKEKNAVENGFNSSYGDGMLGRKHTEASRALISKNHRRYQADATKQEVSELMKGRTVSQETREKISAGNKGKKRTPEQRQAQSEMRKGKVPRLQRTGRRNGLSKMVVATGRIINCPMKQRPT